MMDDAEERERGEQRETRGSYARWPPPWYLWPPIQLHLRTSPLSQIQQDYTAIILQFSHQNNARAA